MRPSLPARAETDAPSRQTSAIGRWHAGSVDSDQIAATNVPEVAGRCGERWQWNPIQCRGMQNACPPRLPAATDKGRAHSERIGGYLRSREHGITQSVALAGPDTTSAPGWA